MSETPGFDPTRGGAEEHAVLSRLHDSTQTPGVKSDRLIALEKVAAENPFAGPDTVRQAVAQEQGNITPIRKEDVHEQPETEGLQQTG